MSPTEFRHALQHPGIGALFDHWRRWRRDRLMPEWHEILPEEMAPLLPNVWAWRIDEAGEPRIRLTGENIASMVKVTTRGKSLTDLYPADYAEEIREEFARVLDGPACCYAIGALDNAGTSVGRGQRLCLPYGAPDGTGRGILGISYHPMVEHAYLSVRQYSRLVGDKRFLQLVPGP